MARYALVRTADGLITNVVEWDGTTEYVLPTGRVGVADAAGVAEIGGTWTGSAFMPAPPPPPPTAAEIQAATDLANCKAFMQSVNGSATNAQRDAVIKAFMRLVRAELSEP